MKFGMQTPFNERTPPELIGGAGQIAEELGFDSFWVPEHVMFFPEYASHYPYSEDGKIPGTPTSLIDPFMALTWVAAHTSKIRLGTGICLVPQRQPVYCAKQVADLDYLSGGRFEFGVGIGWLKEEFESLGVPWPRRAARTEECLAVMQTLWQDDLANFNGEFYTVENAQQGPKPVQQPHPPILFGGESKAALRRVATVGQGWYGFNLTPESFAAHLVTLDGLLEQAGRSRADLAIYVSPNRDHLNAESVRAFGELGCQQIITGVAAASLDRFRERAEATLARLM